jgi:dsRNA-specific ribonuclease
VLGEALEEFALFGTGIFQVAAGKGRMFIAEVWFNGQQLGRGSGSTKKAEQAAAKSSLELINHD